MRKSFLARTRTVVLILLAAAAIMLLCTYAAYTALPFLYSLLGAEPGPYWKQAVFATVVFILFIGCVGAISSLMSKKHMLVWDMIQDAMRRMAKGDFSVSIDLPMDEKDRLRTIVSNVNLMAAELGALEKMRQEFISNVSHEIQSPLTSIQGFAKAIKQENLSAEARLRYITIIETESERLSKISDNLLKLTSLESKHHPFEQVAYRLDKQLRSVVLANEPKWLEQKLDMEVELEPVTFRGDRDLMSQVWINLLSNAIKFTPDGGTIRIGLSTREGRARVTVADTGIGLTEEDRQHVFERFYKADKSRTASGGGSGLGLSIVQKIIEMHGGKISVKSRPGEGTVFLVELPLETQEPDA
ncbi:HAMP domain-containing sensor histidine kinase [Paenibacillus chitinolyticus]|uniref:HAMP domain-containing sensor histidine kinase n=1 Tax=Paenibacillus chitinolyticus TaxID=79263 RepID=UPI002DC05A00|nr:HAMP domain-containing sensor histidine kinase [Paenibacillus chitinolyticus]MEC0246021.1 HAMP domain-containing sensor histidine kinase [Paenibacillus chitinolyticus]